MPSRIELRSIVKTDISNPAIDSDHFPDVNLGAPVNGIAWSASPFSGSGNGAWGVYFSEGYGYYGDVKSVAYAVRLVRFGR